MPDDDKRKWRSEEEKQEQIYGIVRNHGPISANEVADQVAGGGPRRGVLSNTWRILKVLSGAEKVQDINKGAEGTKPQYVIKTPTKHEPKLVLPQNPRRSVKAKRGGTGFASPADQAPKPTKRAERQQREQQKEEERRKREEYYDRLKGGSGKSAPAQDTGGSGWSKPASAPAPKSPPTGGGKGQGLGLGTPAGETRGGDKGGKDDGPRDGKII